MIKLESITSYKIASELSDEICEIISKWNILSQKTIGEQLIKSINSIAANIAEAEGRYFKKDKIRFLYQARGSLYESAHWIEKAKKRKLITGKQYEGIIEKLRRLPKEINYLISNINKNLIK